MNAKYGEPLVRCASFGYFEIAKYLLSQNADVSLNKNLALKTSIRNGHDAITKLLIENKANCLDVLNDITFEQIKHLISLIEEKH